MESWNYDGDTWSGDKRRLCLEKVVFNFYFPFQVHAFLIQNLSWPCSEEQQMNSSIGFVNVLRSWVVYRVPISPPATTCSWHCVLPPWQPFISFHCSKGQLIDWSWTRPWKQSPQGRYVKESKWTWEHLHMDTLMETNP